MQTEPKTPPKSTFLRTRTVGAKERAEVEAMAMATEKVDYAQIQKPRDVSVVSVSCKGDFSYERDRVHAMQQSGLFTGIQVAPTTLECKIYSLMEKGAMIKDPIANHASDIERSFDSLATCVKYLAVIMTLLSTMFIIGVFFGMVFLSLNDVPMLRYMAWITIEIVLTAVYMYLSVLIAGLSRDTLQNDRHRLKFLLVFSIVLTAILVILHVLEDIGKSISRVHRWRTNEHFLEDPREAMLSLTILCVFFSCVAKLVVTLIYTAIYILLRSKLQLLLNPQAPFNDSLGKNFVPDPNTSHDPVHAYQL